jgi:hypothetical protein
LSHVLTVHHDDNKLHLWCDCDCCWTPIEPCFNYTSWWKQVTFVVWLSIGVQQQSQSHYKCNLLSSWCIVKTWLNWRSTAITITPNWAMF